jgi:acetyltransferase-like isoleucine patch superfamily enzyme
MKKFYRILRYDLPLHLVLLITNWLPDNVVFIRLRGFLASPFFKSCGRKLGIGRNVTFYDCSKIELGNNVYIAYGCWFSAGFGIEIHDEVMFGPYNVIASSNHVKENNSYRFAKAKGSKIVIQKGVWIGSHCTITQGAKIGFGSVVAANTVALGQIPENTLLAGDSLGKIKIKKND